MKQSYHDENEHKYIMDRAKELAGQDDKGLLQWAAEAEKAWDEHLEADPELAKRYAQDRDRQLEMLKSRLEARKAAREEEAITEENTAKLQVMDKSAEDKPRKKYKINKKVIGLLVAAVLLIAGGSMASTARNGYRYNSYPDLGKRTNAARFNFKPEEFDDSLDLVYQEIEDQLHIPVVVLGWKPDEMWVIDTDIRDNKATIIFEYKGERIYLKESSVLNERSTYAMFSDRKKTESIYNRWLDKTIEIEMNKLADSKMEFDAEFRNENGYYYIEGKMDIIEFEEIVKNMMYR